MITLAIYYYLIFGFLAFIIWVYYDKKKAEPLVLIHGTTQLISMFMLSIFLWPIIIIILLIDAFKNKL